MGFVGPYLLYPPAKGVAAGDLSQARKVLRVGLWRHDGSYLLQGEMTWA